MIGRRDSVEDIVVHAGPVALRACLGVPQGPIGLVIFAHGSGSSRLSPRNRHVAEALRARGIATLLCDLLTESEELADRIDATLRFDIELLANRLLAITDWVRMDSNVAHLPLAYFGASTGAAAALVAASRRPEHVRAVVSRGGRPDLAGGALPLVHAPTLLAVGSEDRDVLELNREAIERMTVSTQLAIVPGATHLFEEPGALDEVAQLAGEWLVDHFAQGFAEPRHAGWGRQFADRRAAGQRLAAALRHYGDSSTRVVIYGLPRGGVPVADEIAKALGAPLDVWLVRKIGMPIQPELGMGAIAEGAALVFDPELVKWSGASPREVRALVRRKVAEIRRAAKLYRGAAAPSDVHGKTAILVDDGVATGNTLRAAVHGAKKRGAARVVVAAPVASPDAIAMLRREADEVVCLSEPEHLIAVSAWYQNFHQLADDEVLSILAEARRRVQVNAQPTGGEPRAPA
ncbi:MAG TPA: phosphoribosyltransferase family protein [Kofleriaceae bacterium]|jgi:predicted phosphoribosyltransferase/predicted alpha/beta-hydrolase family hydrolase